MAKAINEKRIGDMSDVEREQYEERHRKKHEDLDKMIAKNRARQERLEKINPGHVPYPMSVEDTEAINEILKDVPDEELSEEKVKEARDKHVWNKKLKTIEEHRNNEG